MASRVLPKIDIISEKLVKPSSPTPSSKYYKLSHFDAIVMDTPGPMAFFYSKESIHGINPCMELLESSLSKTLDYYYLFAGRLAEDKISIHCNDAGVKLLEVQIQASMSEILDAPADHNVKNIVYPREMYQFNQDSCRVLIQLSHFKCGGICVAVCISHELGDGQTVFNFINAWATITRELHNIHPTLFQAPIFSETSFFPPLDHSYSSGRKSNPLLDKKITTITRRFVFSASSISKLKKLVVNDDSEIKYPSKVEVVTALIFMCAVSASKKISGSFKPSTLVHAVNFRSLTRPPLSNQYLGNLVTGLLITANEEREMKLPKLVTKLKKSKLEAQDAFRSTLPEGNELFPLVSKYYEDSGKIACKNNMDMYVFTSLCKLPLYHVDFGWGKPIHAFSCITEVLEKGILLTDTPSGDGIEAFVTLKEDLMSIFQQDQYLLSFATVNPNICVLNRRKVYDSMSYLRSTL